MGFVTSPNWRLKLLIAGATVVAAAVALAVAEAGSREIWSGRTTVTIGQAPRVNQLMVPTNNVTLSPIETPRQLSTRISDPGFRAEVSGQAKFEPSTAARSRSLVVSTMRGITLEGERELAIELSAASPADVEAAFQALGSQIEKVHNAIFDSRKKFLQDRVTLYKSQMLPAGTSILVNSTDSTLENYTNLIRFSEPSVVHLEAGSLVQSHRSVAALRASLLTGFSMLVAIVALTAAVNLRTRLPSR